MILYIFRLDILWFFCIIIQELFLKHLLIGLDGLISRSILCVVMFNNLITFLFRRLQRDFIQMNWRYGIDNFDLFAMGFRTERPTVSPSHNK
jgi:hypothetical protein